MFSHQCQQIGKIIFLKRTVADIQRDLRAMKKLDAAHQTFF